MVKRKPRNFPKLIARGYRNFANFRIAILFYHGNLALTPH
jgi:hypothetical protein